MGFGLNMHLCNGKYGLYGPQWRQGTEGGYFFAPKLDSYNTVTQGEAG